MATNFPTSLDSLTNPTASDKLNSVTVPHASQHADINDAVEALEAKVGVDGSSVVTSHDYLIDKQSVVPYDDASARTTAVPSPVEGQMSYLKDTNTVEVYDGSAWAAVGGGTYTDYTPSFTNFTLGNGTVVARYTQVQDFVHYWGLITLGSTSSMGTAPRLTLPVTSANTTNNNFSSNVWYENPGVQNNTGVMTTIVSGAEAYFSVFVTNLTYGAATALSPSVPYTWGTGDMIQFNMVYEAA